MEPFGQYEPGEHENTSPEVEQTMPGGQVVQLFPLRIVPLGHLHPDNDVDPGNDVVIVGQFTIFCVVS